MIKQIAILVGFFIATIIINSLFQTACQAWLGIQVEGRTQCRLTEPLKGNLYPAIILILTVALYVAFTWWRQRRLTSQSGKSVKQ